MENDPYTLITGGLGGLGSAFALECGQRGQNLFLVDQRPSADEMLTFLQDRFPIQVQYRSCDLANDAQRAELLTQLGHSGFSFSSLINIVGREYEGAFLEKTREEILHMLHLNLEAMVDLTLGILKLRDVTRRFMLVNVASMGGFFPMPYKAVYSSTKRFIINFSLALREEVRAFSNVTVLCPAGLPTNPESMKKIFLQGFWGRMTAQDTAVVARKTLDKAERNTPIYTPGLPNKIMVGLSHLLPERWQAAYLARRWGNQQTHLDLWRLTEEQRSEAMEK